MTLYLYSIMTTKTYSPTNWENSSDNDIGPIKVTIWLILWFPSLIKSDILDILTIFIIFYSLNIQISFREVIVFALTNNVHGISRLTYFRIVHFIMLCQLLTGWYKMFWLFFILVELFFIKLSDQFQRERSAFACESIFSDTIIYAYFVLVYTLT